jgi:L-ascorbate metabolism protein UlaG (beta-lactamase superfamily)
MGCSIFSAPLYRGPEPRGARFDGERFLNEQPTESRGVGDLVKWRLTGEPGPWREWTDAPWGPPPPPRVGRGELRVTFVNHATTLVQIDGINILTDPVWSHRVGPVSFAGPTRVRPPGIRFEDLPEIDVVVVSHNHYDHMDIPTLRRLGQAFNPRFFVGLGNAPTLHEQRIGNVAELDWWQTVELRNGVKLTAVPAQHGSNRGLADRNRTLWAGFVFEGAGGYAYFAGDTGFGPHFAEIRERFGAPRLAILPIGAFRPVWFMHPVHVSPAQAVEAHQALGARRSVGMHFGTFPLADDGQDEPVKELAAARAREGVSADHFWVLGFGEGRDVPVVED